MSYFLDSGPKFTGLPERGRDRSSSHVFPILDIVTRSGDIRDQIRKLCNIDPAAEGKIF